MSFMRKRPSSLLALSVMMACGAAPAMADRIQINFHGGDRTTASPNWNNVSVDGDGGTTLINLINSTGVSTNVSLTIDEDHHFNGGGGFTNAITLSGDAATYFPSDVGGTYAFGSQAINPLTQITFSNLDTSATYDFTLLAFRATDGTTDRDSQFTLSGTTAGSTVLNATNDGSVVGRILGIAPDANGNILLSINAEDHPANGWYYVSGIVIDVVPEPASLGLLALGGGLCLLGRRRP